MLRLHEACPVALDNPPCRASYSAPHRREPFMDKPIAFVLLERHCVPSAEALAGALQRSYPNVPFALRDPAVFQFAGEMAVVMSVDAPLPVSSSDELWNRASLTWPEAR